MKLNPIILLLACFITNIISAQNNKQILEFSEFGNLLFSQGRYSDAITIYTNALELTTEDQKLSSYMHHSRGYAYTLSIQDSLAILDYKRAINLDSTNLDAHHMLVLTLFNLKKYEEAIKTGHFAINCIGENYYIRSNIASSYYDLKENKMAIKEYTFAINVGCENNYAYIRRGYSYANLNDLKNAQINFDKAFNYEEGYFSHEAYAWYYRQISNYEKAIINYKAALSYESTYNCYKFLAFTLIDNNNEYESIAYLDSALILVPSGLLYHNRANSYAEIGEFDKALLDYNSSIELDSMVSDTYSNRAYCVWFKTKDYKFAKQDLQIAITLNDSSAHAWNNLGYANYKLHDRNEALSTINHAIKLNPKNSYCYKNLALIYYKENNFKKAKFNANKAIELNYPCNEDNEFLKLMKKLNISLP